MDEFYGRSTKRARSRKCQLLEEQLAEKLAKITRIALDGTFVKDDEERKPLGSVQPAKEGIHYKHERTLAIESLLELPDSPKVRSWLDEMQRERETCLSREYTIDSLPLLLHQFFLDRAEQLLRCRSMYLQRWARWKSNVCEPRKQYDQYCHRLCCIQQEYDDSFQRSMRLSDARDNFLQGKANRPGLIASDDVAIFLRATVTKNYCQKKVTAFLKRLQSAWLLHGQQLHTSVSSEADQEDLAGLSVPLRKQPAPRKWKASLRRLSVLETKPATKSVLAQEHLLERALKTEIFITRPKSVKEDETHQEQNDGIQAHTVRRAGQQRILSTEPGGPSSDPEGHFPRADFDLKSFRPLLEFLADCYNIDLAGEELETPASQLKVFYSTKERFKAEMEHQESLRTFPPYHTPKELDGNREYCTDLTHAWKKTTNWCDEFDVVPNVDPTQEQIYGVLSRIPTDKLVEILARSTHLHNVSQVTYALKRHVWTLRNPQRPRGEEDSTCDMPYLTASVNLWTQIFSGIDPNDPTFEGLERRGKDNSEEFFSTKVGNKNTLFDVGRATSVLEGREGPLFVAENSPVLKDVYMAFVLLRHLRIRDLQRTSLSVLNYFRSVERTLAIGLGGLAKGSREGAAMSNSWPGQPRDEEYLYDTPADFQFSATEFMKFQKVENHDDFYSFEDGRVHVRDVRGHYIIYDTAIEDLRSVEDQLIQVGTHYVMQAWKGDDDLLSAAVDGTFDKTMRENLKESLDYCENMDYFGILLDLWNHHTAFLRAKQKLLNCYLEAYHNTFDQHERRYLAQVMVDIMAQKPRLCLDEDYFSHSYELECKCLQRQTQLARDFMSSQVRDEQNYRESLHADGAVVGFGYPPPVVGGKAIRMTTEPNLTNVALLDFYPSVALVSRLPLAVSRALEDVCYQLGERSTQGLIRLHLRVLECAIEDWVVCSTSSRLFQQAAEDKLLNDVIMDKAVGMDQVLERYNRCVKTDCSEMSKSVVDTAKNVLDGQCRVLELVTLWKRLRDAATETAYLNAAYISWSKEFAFEPFHTSMLAAYIDRPVEGVTSQFSEELTLQDLAHGKHVMNRWSPRELSLAIDQLDSTHFSCSFQTQDDAFRILASPQGIDKVQAILLAQISEKNALLVATHHTALLWRIRRRANPITAFGQRTAGSRRPSIDDRQPAAATAAANGMAQSIQVASFLNSSFLSLQIYKVAARKCALQNIPAVSEQVLKQRLAEEALRQKRGVVGEFCQKLTDLVGLQALRLQILHYVEELRSLLEDERFAAIRQSIFRLGSAQHAFAKEKAAANSALSESPGDVLHINKHFRPTLARPDSLFSLDGKDLVNLWYLPHALEVLSMFDDQPITKCRGNLKRCLDVVANFHDVCVFIFTRACLGLPNSADQEEVVSVRPVSGHWGGVSGISNELMEIQDAISKLDDPYDPSLVSRYLSGVRTVKYLELIYVFMIALPVAFLQAGKADACKLVQTKSVKAMERLRRKEKNALDFPMQLLPSPLHTFPLKARHLLPWRAFCEHTEVFPSARPRAISSFIHSAVDCLDKWQRPTVSGELRSVAFDHTKAVEQVAARKLKPSSSTELQASAKSQCEKRSGQAEDCSLAPLEDVVVRRDFLRLSMCLGRLKTMWFVQRGGQEAVRSPQAYILLRRIFDQEVMDPAWTAKARGKLRHGVLDSEDKIGQASAWKPKSQVLTVSELRDADIHLTETEERQSQVDLLLDELECHMIRQTIKRAEGDLILLTDERSRPTEEDQLPTELWKKNYTGPEDSPASNPMVVREFGLDFMNLCEEEGDNVVLAKDDLDHLLTIAASKEMCRERHLYQDYQSMFAQQLQNVEIEKDRLKKEAEFWKQKASMSEEHIAEQTQQELVKEVFHILTDRFRLSKEVLRFPHKIRQMERETEIKMAQRYRQLVDRLVATTLTNQELYENHRIQVQNDVVKAAYRVRDEYLAKLREVRCARQSKENPLVMTAIKNLPEQMKTSQELSAVKTQLIQQQRRALLSHTQTKLRHDKEVTALRILLENEKARAVYKSEEMTEYRQQKDEAQRAMEKRMQKLKAEIKDLERQVAELRQNEMKLRYQHELELMNRRHGHKPIQDNVPELKLMIQTQEAKIQELARDLDRAREMSRLAESRSAKTIHKLHQDLKKEMNVKALAVEQVEQLTAEMSRSTLTSPTLASRAPSARSPSLAQNQKLLARRASRDALPSSGQATRPQSPLLQQRTSSSSSISHQSTSSLTRLPRRPSVK